MDWVLPIVTLSRTFPATRMCWKKRLGLAINGPTDGLRYFGWMRDHDYLLCLGTFVCQNPFRDTRCPRTTQCLHKQGSFSELGDLPEYIPLSRWNYWSLSTVWFGYLHHCVPVHWTGRSLLNRLLRRSSPCRITVFLLGSLISPVECRSRWNQRALRSHCRAVQTAKYLWLPRCGFCHIHRCENRQAAAMGDRLVHRIFRTRLVVSHHAICLLGPLRSSDAFVYRQSEAGKTARKKWLEWRTGPAVGGKESLCRLEFPPAPFESIRLALQCLFPNVSGTWCWVWYSRATRDHIYTTRMRSSWESRHGHHRWCTARNTIELRLQSERYPSRDNDSKYARAQQFYGRFFVPEERDQRRQIFFSSV